MEVEVEGHALTNFDLHIKTTNPFSFSLNTHNHTINEMSGFRPSSPDHVHDSNGPDKKYDISDLSSTANPNRNPNPNPDRSDSSAAAVKLQKVYKGYRTRRQLADSAVVAVEFWWQAIDYARLNRSTVSFFNFLKPENAHSRWARVTLNASKVGKGLSVDDKAQKLAFQHWIEAIDPRHRYGHNLHYYYEEWCKGDAGQPFFYWLDVGDGKEVDLKECPKSKLQKQCIKYLGPQERDHYEYTVDQGTIIHKQTGNLLDTKNGSQGAKYIFVMSTLKKFYVGEKKKGVFHHSSFLAGGATLAAGKLEAEDGVLKSISAYSGHYRPSEDSLETFLSFLKGNGINLDEVDMRKANEDYEPEGHEQGKISGNGIKIEFPTDSEPSILELPTKEEDQSSATPKLATTESKGYYQRTLSGGLRSLRAEVPKTAILKRIDSKKDAKSYQLGHQLSLKWSTGAGPRIGCVADYPKELIMEALEFVNLSPRFPPTPSRKMVGLLSPTALSSPFRPPADFPNLDGTSFV